MKGEGKRKGGKKKRRKKEKKKRRKIHALQEEKEKKNSCTAKILSKKRCFFGHLDKSCFSNAVSCKLEFFSGRPYQTANQLINQIIYFSWRRNSHHYHPMGSYSFHKLIHQHNQNHYHSHHHQHHKDCFQYNIHYQIPYNATLHLKQFKNILICERSGVKSRLFIKCHTKFHTTLATLCF